MLPDSRFADHPPVSDSDYILQSSGALGVGEFDLFALADRWWHGDARPEQALEPIFLRYVHTGAAPLWVRRFCETVLDLANKGRLDPRRFGARALRTRPLARMTGWKLLALTVGAAAFMYRLFLRRPG